MGDGDTLELCAARRYHCLTMVHAPMQGSRRQLSPAPWLVHHKNIPLPRPCRQHLPIRDMAKDTMRPNKVLPRTKGKQKTLRERRDVDIMNVRFPSLFSQASLFKTK